MRAGRLAGAGDVVDAKTVSTGGACVLLRDVLRSCRALLGSIFFFPGVKERRRVEGELEPFFTGQASLVPKILWSKHIASKVPVQYKSRDLNVFLLLLKSRSRLKLLQLHCTTQSSQNDGSAKTRASGIGGRQQLSRS